MDENGLPITGAGVDYSSVEAISQRELITYFNMFVVRTCAFLNTFSTKCESKLAVLNARLESIDASITLLETKLDSVDELKDMKLEENQTNAEAHPPNQQLDSNIPAQPEQQIAQNSEVEPATPIMTVSEDDRFKQYFKMLKFGVSEESVKLKMKSDGIDPGILSDPNAPSPP